MARIDVSDPKALKTAAEKYLSELPSDIVCALQVWYEGLGGQGVPSTAEMEAMHGAIAAAPGWSDIGNTRFEKFGMQQSFKRK